MTHTTRVRKIEITLYLIAFILALGLRFINLGALPLSDSEAVNAIQALKVSDGAAIMIGGQPGYVALTSMLFFLLGKTSFWARFWPALFGSMLVFIPLLFKKRFGSTPMLMLAFFFAVEPGLTALSRTSTGTIIGIVSLLAAFGFLYNQKVVHAGIFTGLAFLGGVAFWPGLLGLLLSFAIFSFTKKYWLGTQNSSEEEDFPAVEWKTLLITTGCTLVILGTVFFIHPFVISGLGTSIVNYFKSWAQFGTGVSVKVMLIALFGEQILAIVLAFWGAIAGWKKHSALNLFLGLWAIVSTLLVLLNPVRQVVDWAWTLLPLWILTAFGLENLVQRFNVENGLLKLFQTVATFALIIFSYLNFLSGVVGAVNSSALQENYILSVILPLALLVVVTILVGWGWSSEAAWQGLLLGIGLLLVMITFGSAWKSAGLGPRPEAELWRSDAYPVGRDLTLKSVKNISLWNTGQETGIDLVLLNQNQASLQWELHDFENLKETNVLGDSDTPSLIISSAENELSLTKSYRGQEIVWSSAPDFANMSAENWVKWFAFRQVPLKNTSILLWAKNDLFKGS